MRLFISYRRSASGALVDHLKARLKGDHSISAFVDRDDILKGLPFPAEIEQALRDAQVVLAVIGPNWVTSREVQDDWCYRELSFAHKLAVDDQWRKPIVPVLHGGAETPRAHQLPPELGFLEELNAVTFDPNRPTDEEADRLATHLRSVDREMAVRLQPDLPLAGVLVALSASPPNLGEFRSDGQSAETLLFFLQVLTERLLTAGADVSFAGLDPAATTFSSTNVTYRLRQVAQVFGRQGGRNRVFNYLAPGIGVPDDRPFDGFTHLVTTTRELPPSTGDQTVDRALGFLMMRKAATADCHARICIGGKLSGFAGRLPGVLEEVYLTLQRQRPVYVIGGFGGVSGALAEQLSGRSPASLTLTGQITAWPEDVTPSRASYIELLDQLAGSLHAVSYSEIRRHLAPGWTALGNTLSANENADLATTDDADHAAEFLVRDLGKLARRAAPSRAARPDGHGGLRL